MRWFSTTDPDCDTDTYRNADGNTDTYCNTDGDTYAHRHSHCNTDSDNADSDANDDPDVDTHTSGNANTDELSQWAATCSPTAASVSQPDFRGATGYDSGTRG